MAYFPSSIIPKSLSPCTESTSREMNVLEFPGGIAYDHEALPKIVAVHTLFEVSPEQINAQDVTMTSKDVKKKESAKIPVAHESGTRHGNRRWIILSKPEQPFSQITTAPKTPEERFQTQPPHNPSCHDTFPRKKLFNLCDINHGSYCEDVDDKSRKITKSGGVCRDMFSIPHNQEFSSCADIGCTATEPVASRQSRETEERKEIITSKISNQLVNSVKLGISPNLKTGSAPATQNLTTPYLAAEGISSGAASGQSIEAVNAKVNIEQEIAVSPRNSLASSKDSVAHCADAKEELPVTKFPGLPIKASKKPEGMVTLCSDPKHASKGSKKILAKSNDAAKVGKVSQKQRAKLSNKKLSTSNPDVEHCGEETSNAKLGETPLTQTFKSQKQSTKCNSAMEQISSTKKRSNSKTGKLSLKERIQNRLNRLEHLKSHKQPSEVIDICEKVSKFTKLGFAVASSLNELSKSGEISHQAQEAKGGGQAKKMMLSEGVVEEMVLMEKLRKESKAFAEFTDKQKDLHLKLSEVIKSKNKKKKSKEMKNSLETNLEDDELAFDSRSSHLSKSLEPSVRKPVRTKRRVSKSEETLEKEGNWKGDEKAEAEMELQLNENQNDNFQSKTTEKGKSLNRCLDKLKFITSSSKRTLEGDKENGLQLTNPDPGSFPKRPRKSAPRRLTVGRWLEDDMDSASPDTAFIDHTNGINFTSSDSEDHLSPSSYHASGKKGNKMEETNGPLYDADSSPTEENNLSSAEENLNLKNANSISVGNPGPCETEKLHALSFIETVSEQAVKERATDSDETLPPARLFTEDTLRQQTEEAAWESCWLSSETKTAPSNLPWVGVHHTSIPRENFTIKTSLDREERIKALLAKQSQLLSKINSSGKET